MRAELRSTAPWIGHKAWTYFSSSRVSAGRGGLTGRETAAKSRREFASRTTARITIPTTISRSTASATSMRRETFSGRVSAGGIIASLLLRTRQYAIHVDVGCQPGRIDPRKFGLTDQDRACF